MITKRLEENNLAQIELYVRFLVWFLDFWKWFSREQPFYCDL